MADNNTDNVLIELDGRRRASLGKLGHHDRYLAREEPDGTIILAPAVVMTEVELLESRLHRNHPDLVADMQESWEHPERRVSRPRRPTARNTKAG